MSQCSPRCPTVRRQIREQIQKSGLTDEYIRSIIGVQRVDITRESDRRSGHKPRDDRRKRSDKRDGADKRRSSRDKELVYGDRSPTTTRDVVRVTDYAEAIDDLDGKPVASFKQESIYYAEKKQVARVPPIRKPTPSQQSLTPSKTSRVQRRPVDEIGESTDDDVAVTYGRGEVDKITAVPYRRMPSTRPDRELVAYDDSRGHRVTSSRERLGRETPSRERPGRGTSGRETPGRGSPDRELPGTSQIEDDRKAVDDRDGSPDSYYKYTPKEVASDWPHEDCDESCPASLLKEQAKKVLKGKRKPDQPYFEDVCTCSLPCVVTQLRKDPFVRNVLTSALLFALGIKLCSELHGWYIPTRV